MTETVSVASPRREVTRQKLLDAAAQVFAEVGLDAASVEAICERAGFTRGAFYSNFESKNELFLALVAAVSGERMRIVRERVSDLKCRADLGADPAQVLGLVQQVLDFDADDRESVLLMSEIRIHALRDAELADAYLAQEDELLQQITEIIDDIAEARVLAFRLPADRTARLMLMAWEGAAIRSVMRGLSAEERRRAVGAELARIAQIAIRPVDAGR
ncbi:TetR/AcrR family transcriptional regulator [Microbacterium awajiense]|uniref:TetR/AcrR family transcriptional regulator n=1 Tax=Microbacterium awajiense TaxID=415214 RepID=A0ABP7AWY1_9MICO